VFPDGLPVNLRLIEARSFPSGVVRMCDASEHPAEVMRTEGRSHSLSLPTLTCLTRIEFASRFVAIRAARWRRPGCARNLGVRFRIRNADTSDPVSSERSYRTLLNLSNIMFYTP